MVMQNVGSQNLNLNPHQRRATTLQSTRNDWKPLINSSYVNTLASWIFSKLFGQPSCKGGLSSKVCTKGKSEWAWNFIPWRLPQDRFSLKTSLYTRQGLLKSGTNYEKLQEACYVSCIDGEEERHAVSFGDISCPGRGQYKFRWTDITHHFVSHFHLMKQPQNYHSINLKSNRNDPSSLK